MPLYQHSLFTIDLSKVIAVYQENEGPMVAIRTDDQRKIEVATETADAATDLLQEIADQWEKTKAPLLRHGTHVFLASAIYSIQVEGDELFIFFRDHSISFAFDDSERALDLLSELSRHWRKALGEET